jgi:hypothetical protein
MNKELLKSLGKTALVSLIVVVLYNAAFSKKCDCSNCAKPAAVVAEQVIDSVK